MKLVAYLIGYLLRAFSFCVPRSKKIWAFGSFRGAFTDNAKYLFIYVSRACPEVFPVWISYKAATVRAVRAAGLRACSLFSLPGLYYALRAGTYFFNAYSSDICYFTAGRALCVNLWHGVGLKKIEFCVDKGALYDRYVRKTLRERFYYPQVYRRPDYFLSSTPFQTVKFAQAFRIPESRCLPLGYPRNDILLLPEPARRSFIRQYAPPATEELIQKCRSYSRVFLYMPTWRESQRNLFAEHLNLEALLLLMQRYNALLLLKPHANVRLDARLRRMEYSNLLLLEGGLDVYPLLPYTDVLITDYSSVLYDYLLMDNKGVILYLYDYAEYINERDFNYPFLENVAGELAYTFPELLSAIKRDTYDTSRYPLIRSRFWGDYHGDASRTVAQYFLDKIKS